MFQRSMSHPSCSLRVVVETDDATLAVSDFSCFRDAGFDVAVCSGPDTEHRCPAIDGEPCALVASAAVVVNAFTDASTQHAVAHAVHATAPKVPMVVSVVPGMSDELPDGCTTLRRHTSVNGQTDAVRRAALSRR